jgi:TolB-like protein/DNA-binding winged helix-turn-helix (wHTH) protein/cytochrome c-type biogenesis protein CcmH/NrfG
MIYRFGRFQVDDDDFRLSADGLTIPLEPRTMSVLLYLIRNRNRVIRKGEILDGVWKEANVTEGALTRSIGLLRRALEDDSREPRFIETVPTVGFRFVAKVSVLEAPAEAPATPAPTLPAPVEASPSGKPQTQMLAHPRRLWLLAGLLAGLALPILLGWFARRQSEAPAPIRSLAVLPFQNLSNDPDEEYFAQGITEELITNLGYAKSLRVLSRASTAAFKNSQLSLPQIAEQLQVDGVIEGTVLRSNNTIRVTIRLTAAKPERQLWAASYERDARDTITLQNRIAAEAVTQIRSQLTPEEQSRLSVKGRVDPEAYDDYLRARFFLDHEPGQKDKAIPHLEHAIQIDPHFAAAYALLGEAWGLQGVWGGMSNQQASAKALQYSREAVSLDPASSEAFASLGHSLMQSRRWNEGEVALRRAIDLDPNNPYAREYLAQLLAQKGRVDEGVRISRDVAMAEPVAVDFQRSYADMLYRARRYDEAINQCQRVLELDPNHQATYTTLANALLETGHYKEAEAAFTEGHFMDPGVQAWLDVRAGNPAAARQLLNENPNLINVHSAVARYLLGDQEVGLSQLDYLANEKWAVKTYHLRNDPTFDAMRNDPRFSAIVKKSGLLDD